MSQVQLATVFLQPSTITGSEEATNHAAANAGIFPKPWRTARSTTTTSPWTVTWNFGAAVTPPGFYLNNANFGLFKAQVSVNGTTWVDLYSGGVPQSFGVDDRVQPRRKQWFPASGFTGTVWNHQYFRLLAQTLDSGATYFELGAVAFPQALVNMTRNWGPPEFTPKEPITRLNYPGGGGEGNVEGRNYLAFDLTFGPNFKDALPQLHVLRTIGQDLPFLMYENRGDPTHVYVLKRVAEVKFTETFATLQAAPWTLEECV